MGLYGNNPRTSKRRLLIRAGEFVVGELFETVLCVKLTKKDLIPGDTLLVTNAKSQTQRIGNNVATYTKVLNTKIKLPVDKNGEIDFNKIKRVVSELLDIAENRLNDLKEIFLNGYL